MQTAKRRRRTWAIAASALAHVAVLVMALLQSASPLMPIGEAVQPPDQVIHVLLQCPADLRSRWGPDRRGRLIVRVVEVRLDVDVLDLVRPARVHRSHLREEASFTAVRTTVEHKAAWSRP